MEENWEVRVADLVGLELGEEGWGCVVGESGRDRV